jgi:hypothetical protein
MRRVTDDGLIISTFLVCCLILFILFIGKPDLMDAIIYLLTNGVYHI